MTINNKVKEEKPQYKINREAGTISALSSSKSEFELNLNGI